jgi:glutathione S-transferase
MLPSGLAPGAMSDDSRPTLWHINVSHYSEKARWALDYKEVPHTRRAVAVPGLHIAASMWMTRGASKTYPVLEIDGRRIGDSTAIIAALEERFPEPPLYPADPERRRRALELEDFFDEELGPHIRLLAFHELGKDPERFQAVVERTTPGPLTKIGGGAVVYARTYTGLRFGVRDEEAAEVARGKIVAALDRLESELGSGEYLVGDSFSVADLTAASLFFPLVLPDEGPLPGNEPPPAGMESFGAPLRERPGYAWVEKTFRKHRRRPSGALAGAAAPQG